ncbi:MAG: single-stranded-DNA-specific exonuclease RecJ [Candidatus Pacebacteria bacterium]|nr:single-stranded-DNA-specific exonuclease RecJ [Candidatus Paceibacterota bacterium]
MTDYTHADAIDTNHELLKHYSPLLAQLLVNRGLDTQEKAEAFINPDYSDNHNPFLLHNLTEGIDRLHAAIKNNEKITIYADYDADGIPGAVILSSLLDKIKYDNYDVYIPHRHNEGYGIHIEALEKIKENGTTLIITIDVGITAHEAADWCKNNDIDLIITDHHLPLVSGDGTENLPEALYLINPKQSECSYPDPMLCGCGVIYKFIQGFLELYRDEFNVHEGWEKWLLDMVGISTISDLVPLQNENRIFAKYGMQVIKKTKRPGLKKLLWDAGITTKFMTAEDIAFGISPKINAASRMSHPEDAYNTFMAKNDAEATDRVKHLIGLNNNRKKLVAQTMKQAYKKLGNRDIKDLLVIGSPDWSAGILGLIASKLVEKYKIPVFVWSEEHGEIKGSCRSYDGHHLVNIMSSAEPETFIGFGGHAEAGGFSCQKNEIHFLEERLKKGFEKVQKTTPEKETLSQVIDTELSLDDVTIETITDLKKLAPFGMANEKPLFIFKNIIPEHVGQFGKTQEHIEILFKNSQGKKVRAINFFKTPEDYTKIPTEQKPCSVIGHIEYSVFMGKHEVRIKLIDVI